MASGGARARSGPPADPNALRRDRKEDAAGWLTLPAERTGPAPEWPLPDQTSREAVLWASEWKRPQATEWERLGLELEVALYVRVFAVAETLDASGKDRDFVRMSRENLGLSIPGLARHRWIIPASTSSAKTPSSRTSTSAPRRSSARDRFTVVPPPTVDEPEDDPAPF